MTKEIHPNYIRSSNLLFAMAGIILANFLLMPGQLKNLFTIISVFAGFVIFIGIGLLIRRGRNWIKYVLLGFTLFGVITIPMIIITFYPKSIPGALNILQQVLQLWALVLLFLIPKVKNEITTAAKENHILMEQKLKSKP